MPIVRSNYIESGANEVVQSFDFLSDPPLELSIERQTLTLDMTRLTLDAPLPVKQPVLYIETQKDTLTLDLIFNAVDATADFETSNLR